MSTVTSTAPPPRRRNPWRSHEDFTLRLAVLRDATTRRRTVRRSSDSSRKRKCSRGARWGGGGAARRATGGRGRTRLTPGRTGTRTGSGTRRTAGRGTSREYPQASAQSRSLRRNSAKRLTALRPLRLRAAARWPPARAAAVALCAPAAARCAGSFSFLILLLYSETQQNIFGVALELHGHPASGVRAGARSVSRSAPTAHPFESPEGEAGPHMSAITPTPVCSRIMRTAARIGTHTHIHLLPPRAARPTTRGALTLQ